MREGTLPALLAMNEQHTDEEARDVGGLVRRAARGDAGAFEELMLRHQKRVQGMALRLLGSQDDARDAAQEVFLRLYRYAGSIDASRPLRPWLYGVTMNVCRDILRRRGAEDARVDRTGAEQRAADPGASAEDAAIARQQQDLLRRALLGIPERERLALVLRDVEGFDTRAVARMLGTTEVTVRSQVSRGRLRLKGLVDRLIKRSRP